MTEENGTLDRAWLTIEKKTTIKIGDNFHTVGLSHGLARSVPEGKNINQVKEELLVEILEFLEICERIAKEEFQK